MNFYTAIVTFTPNLRSLGLRRRRRNKGSNVFWSHWAVPWLREDGVAFAAGNQVVIPKEFKGSKNSIIFKNGFKVFKE